MTLRMKKTIATVYTIILLSAAAKHGFAQRFSVDASLPELTKIAEKGDFYKDEHYPQYLLGRRYYEGSGGAPRDAATAVKWFNSSVNCGGVSALMYLAACHKDGDGVFKDAEQSKSLSDRYMEFFRKNGKERVGIHHLEMGKVYYRRGILGSPEHLRQAVQEFEASSTAGNADSSLFLATCCLDGAGVAQSKEKGMEYFDKYLERISQHYRDLSKQAKNGDVLAKKKIYTFFNSALGRLHYDEGHSYSMESRKKAVQYLTKAASEGDQSSLSILSSCYRQGYGVPKDESMAEDYSKKSSEALAARINSEKQSAKQSCEKFLASETQVSKAEIRSAVSRWRLIDKLIGYQMPQSETQEKLSREKMSSIEEDAKLYLQAIRDLEAFKETADRAALFYGKLTEQGIREKVGLERKCSEISGRISLAMDDVDDYEFLKRIVKETDILPGGQRALNAASSRGIYSYEHVSALLWQTRKYGLVINKTSSTRSFDQVLRAIKSDSYNRVHSNHISTLSYDDDSRRLLAAGLIMLEVSRIFDDEKKIAPTDSEKAKLKEVLSDYEYLLEDIADEYEANPTKGTKRMKDTRSAFAFSWNVCRKLIDSQ